MPTRSLLLSLSFCAALLAPSPLLAQSDAREPATSTSTSTSTPTATTAVQAAEQPQSENTPGATATQEDEPGSVESAEENPFSEANRRAMYEQSRLQYSNALLWGLVFPGAGNFYTKNYFWGAMIGMGGVFGLIFLGYGLRTRQSNFNITGLSFLIGSYLAGFGSSLYNVKRHNERRRRDLKLDDPFASSSVHSPLDSPTANAPIWGLQWSWTF